MAKNQIVVTQVRFNKEVVRAKYVDYGNGRYSVRIKGQPVVKIRWCEETAKYGERRWDRAGFEASTMVDSIKCTTPRCATPQKALSAALKISI